jgi:transcriptional regulator with XRE-family HTH domain
MDTNERLRQILDERGLTTYKMSELSGLSHTTLANVFKRNTVPSISTLQAICNGFGITLSQFFAEGDMVEMTPELKQLFEGWVNLNPKQKAAVLQMIEAMNCK